MAPLYVRMLMAYVRLEELIKARAKASPVANPRPGPHGSAQTRKPRVPLASSADASGLCQQLTRNPDLKPAMRPQIQWSWLTNSSTYIRSHPHSFAYRVSAHQPYHRQTPFFPP